MSAGLELVEFRLFSMKSDRPVSLEEQQGVSAMGVADTPSSFSGVASPEALLELEFAAALDTVAEFAVSAMGAYSVRARRPSNGLDWIRSEISAVAELDSLLGDGDEFRPEPIEDISQTIEALGIPGSVLEPGELNLVGGALAAMHSVRQELIRIGEDAPLVSSLVAEVPPEHLGRDIERALEPDGTVKDGASPQLATARRKLRDTRARLRALLEKTLRNVGADAQGEVTVRGGRYVIPLRRDSRSGVKGIVHGESGSGATLFVEPAEAVELGNEVNGWEAEEARAIVAVLRDLTDKLRPHVDLLQAGVDMCVAVDDLYARARYVSETDGHPPTVSQDTKRLRIVSGKHPLLLSEATEPVPFTLGFADKENSILVSGPNAGGKTVLLKAVGLVSALTQAGVIPPVGKGSTLPVFDQIFVDIGDHQSIAASLSTYSAHLAALRDILERADSRSLVLLDEMGGGTDPTEGTALAGAVLQSLNDRNCFTIATTHLSGLKELAARTDGMANASFHFDVETLAPTYRFVKDVPGRSYGLAIARRLGLSDDVLERADILLPEAARTLDSILADLEAREEALAEREAAANAEAARLLAERQNADAKAASLDTRESEVAEKEREVEREGRQQARQYLLDARRRVEEALGVAFGAANAGEAKRARKLVEEGVLEEGEALKLLEHQAKKLGWRVKGSSEQSAGPEPQKTRSLPPSVSAFDLATESASSDIDLRGKNGDEAEAELILALDGAVAGDLPWLRIIHGKGTGALRARVAEVLKLDRRVSSFRLAPPQQGGSGVTIAEFDR
jgi:DNA mismatch repair protein MutS2